MQMDDKALSLGALTMKLESQHSADSCASSSGFKALTQSDLDTPNSPSSPVRTTEHEAAQALHELLLAPGTPTLPRPTKLQHSTSSSSNTASDDEPARPQRFAGKTILIISGGTRGDVQPAGALGVALAGEGARVRLAADPSFKHFVSSLGLEFYPLGANAREMMALTVKWGGMLPTEMSGMFWLRSQIKEVMDSVWLAATDPTPPGSSGNCSRDTDCNSSSSSDGAGSNGVQVPFKPDLILANQLAYGQVSVAEKLGVPLHALYTIPWLPTRHIAHPWARAFDRNITEWFNDAAEALLAPLCGLLGLFRREWGVRLRQWVMPRFAAAMNKMSTPLLDNTAWWGIADILSGFRRRLGLPLLSVNNLGSALYRFPTTCLFSPLLVPKPDDWPSQVTLSGFLSLPDALTRYKDSSSRSSSSSIINSDAGIKSSISQDMSDSSSSSSQGLTSYQPPADLAAFLAAGPPPIYIGFGSMVVQDPQALMQTVLQAGQMLQDSSGGGERVRLLICSGWSGAAHAAAAATAAKGSMTDAMCEQSTAVPQQVAGKVSHQPQQQQQVLLQQGDNSADSSRAQVAKPAGCCPEVFFTSEVPHEWLFPRCSVLVHHGGVGTTASGLKYGKPTLVIAAFGDLFFWGDMCAQLGVGPPALSLKGLTAQQLFTALQQLVQNQSYHTAAQKVAAGLTQEDGLEVALMSVHKTMYADGQPDHRQNCDAA